MLGRSPAIFPLLATIGCVLLADYFRAPALLWWGSAALLLAIVVWWFSRTPGTFSEHWQTLFLSLAIGAGCAAHYQSACLDRAKGGIPDACFTDREVRAFGAVRGWPRIDRGRTEIIVDLDSIEADHMYRLTAAMQVVIDDTALFVQVNDDVIITAGLLRPVPSFGRFSYARYLARQGIGAQAFLTGMVGILRVPRPPGILVQIAQGLRGALVSVLHQVLPPEDAALAAGFLVGETRDLPRETIEMFRDTGTLHYLAVSGANVWLMVGFLALVLRPFPMGRVFRTGLMIIGVIVFAMMCYAEASVTRASLLAILVLAGRLFGRKLDLLHLIAVAALLMLLIAPWQLFSAGFQLSFLTATALVAGLTPVQHWLEKKQVRRFWQGVLLAVAGSVIASVLSAPLIWWHFERVSTVSIPANIVTGPLVTIATVGSLAATVGYFFIPLLGSWIGAIVHLSYQLLFAFEAWFGGGAAATPFPIEHTPVAAIIVFSFYLILLLVLLIPKKQRRFALTGASLLAVIAMAVAGIGGTSHRGNEIIVQPSSGGVIVVMTRDYWKTADMLLHGLRPRRYPVDSAVITPILRQFGVRGVHSIAALDPDYNSLDDLFRLAARWTGAVALLPHSFAPSYAEWRVSDSQYHAVPVRFGDSVSRGPDGISIGSRDYTWRDSLLIFSVGTEPDDGSASADSSRWSVQFEPNDRGIFPAPAANTLMICAKTKHAMSAGRVAGTASGLIDLSRVGGILIQAGDGLLIESADGEILFRNGANAR